MEIEEQQLYKKLGEHLDTKVYNGETVSLEEYQFLLFYLQQSTEKTLAMDKKSYQYFRKCAPLISTVLASFRIGAGYRKDYLSIRTAMACNIDHKRRLLEGISITSNHITDENMYNLVQQEHYGYIYGGIFCEFMDKVKDQFENETSFYQNPVGEKYLDQMEQTRAKILELSSCYRVKK